jgi:predicted ester cyclase
MATVTDVRTAADLMHAEYAAVAAKDLERLSGFWDDHTVQVFLPLQLEVVGETQLRAFFGELFAAVPDLRFVIEVIHDVDAHTAVGQWFLTGTFTGGSFQGIEPTGRRVQLRGIDVMRFEHGKLRTNEVYYDGLTFARQVGMLPAMGSSADRGMRTAFNAATRARRAINSRRH